MRRPKHSFRRETIVELRTFRITFLFWADRDIVHIKHGFRYWGVLGGSCPTSSIPARSASAPSITLYSAGEDRYLPANAAEAVAKTLAYFEPIHHVAGLKATTLFNGGGTSVKPLADAISGTVEQYMQTHEGGTDHDWTDAWMAQQLGSVPKPRLWEVA